MRPPCTPTPLGLCPKTPFKLRPALGLFVSYLATLGAQTNRIARGVCCAKRERGALTVCLLKYKIVAHKVSDTYLENAAKTFCTPHS